MLLGVIFLSWVSTLKERSTIRHGLCNLFSHKRVINLPVREPIKLPCNPRAYLSSHSMSLVPWLLSHSFRQLIHLNTVCSSLSALALHYWLHRSLPLSFFLSAKSCLAECWLALRRLLVALHLAPSDIPHTFSIKPRVTKGPHIDNNNTTFVLYQKLKRELVNWENFD